jgi:alpha-galactosidase
MVDGRPKRRGRERIFMTITAPLSAATSSSTIRQPKIAIMGAGGVVFPLRLMGDMLSFPALRNAAYSLMDLDLGRAERTATAAREIAGHHGFGASIEATDDRRAALEGADYVIVTFMVGGNDVYRHDMEIPRKYGVDQRVGDTLGPGGVFRFLRSYPAYRDIAMDMHELCPKALLINYANPMAMNCWYLTELGIASVGLCHSVQGTSRMLANELGVAYDDISFACAGINHQAWFLKFATRDEDLYPRLRATMRERYLPARNVDGEVPKERVRTEIMDAFGYFHTESSPHASEYLPYFRKTSELIDSYVPKRWDYEEVSTRHDARETDRTLVDSLKTELKASQEYGSWIVNAMETGEPTVIYGNVPNHGLIDNLPAGCSVEVACLVDKSGVQPVRYGALPPQCAAVNRTNVTVQELAVRAALTGERDHVYHAVMLDPLTSAVLTLEQIRAMTAELFAAQRPLMPPELVSCP